MQAIQTGLQVLTHQIAGSWEFTIIYLQRHSRVYSGKDETNSAVLGG